MQQAFLRWNQGQELRQALITIAVSVIVADQIIAHFPRNVSRGHQKFGGNAVDLTWPGWTDRFVNLHVGGVQYSLARLVMLGDRRRRRRRALALALQDEDGHGDPRRRRRRADDLGARDQHPEDVRDHVRRSAACSPRSAPSSGRRSRTSRPGQDGQWLLNSLVVVIVGGMGSIFGAAAGRAPVRVRRELRRVVPADDRLRLLHPVLDDPDLRPDRARALRSGPRGLFGQGRREPGDLDAGSSRSSGRSPPPRSCS